MPEEKEPESTKFEHGMGWISLLAHAHGIIESQRRKIMHLNELFSANLHDVKDIIKFAKDISKVDRQLEEEIMKPVSRGIWSKIWGSIITKIVLMVCISVLIIYFLNWLGFIKLW